MDRLQALDALSALANGTRLDLVRALVAAGPNGMAAGEIARELAVSASRLSFHLTTLEQAGLVTGRRESRHVFYAVDAARLGAIIGYLLNDCCLLHPDVCACCAPHLGTREAGPPAG